MCENELNSRALLKFVTPSLILNSFSVLGTNSDFDNINPDITQNTSNAFPLTSLFSSWTINSNEYASADKREVDKLEGS